MNVKVFVVVLVALVVAAVLVVFYGTTRSAPAPDIERTSVEDALGWLVPRPTLAVADLDPTCEVDQDRLVIPAGGVCTTPVPTPSKIVLCSGQDVQVTTKGSTYPTQTVDRADLRCAAPMPVPIYDEDTVLAPTCPVTETCAVRVLPEAPDPR